MMNVKGNGTPLDFLFLSCNLEENRHCKNFILSEDKFLLFTGFSASVMRR